ncbi:MAG: hypothetical protein ACRDN8_05255 [Thermoleophilaceae bacterium]
MPASRMSEAPVLAAEGYALSRQGSSQRAEQWIEGASRLTERDPFPPDRASFFYRPLELLGIAQGAAACQSNAAYIAAWLRQILEQGASRLTDDIWHQALGALAADAVGEDSLTARIAVDARCAQPDDLALVHWIAEAQPSVAQALSLPNVADLERALLERTATASVEIPDIARATLLYVTLRTAVERTLRSAHEERWQLQLSTRDTVSLIGTLCGRFPRFARELSERHAGREAFPINDEYDLQDAMRALLRLHFDDVRPEEWTPSYAGSRSRLDFLLKREQTVLETKMTRKNLGQRKVVEELTIDKAHYRNHPDCRALVCFVYDPDGRLDNPAALDNDISGSENGLTTTVFVAPFAR